MVIILINKGRLIHINILFVIPNNHQVIPILHFILKTVLKHFPILKVVHTQLCTLNVVPILKIFHMFIPKVVLPFLINKVLVPFLICKMPVTSHILFSRTVVYFSTRKVVALNLINKVVAHILIPHKVVVHFRIPNLKGLVIYHYSVLAIHIHKVILIFRVVHTHLQIS